MITCKVHSNHDKLRAERWPDTLTCKPDIGDCMQSTSGRIGKICRVTHANTFGVGGGPILMIELTTLV